MIGRTAYPFRVLMYSHDTYGLGHLTRTLRIARALLSSNPEMSILVLSGSPVAHWFRFPSRCDHLKLPSIVKTSAEEYVSRDLRVSFERIRRMRRAVLEETAILFRPHLVMVDNVPLGVKGELRPTLERLRRLSNPPKVVLNLRDILDAPEVIRERWEEDGVHEALRTYFDAVFVYGSRAIYDAAEAYALPADRTEFLGYLRSPVPPAAVPAERPRVTVTVGGGGDGAALIRSALEALPPLGRDLSFDTTIVTGPFLPAAEFDGIRDQTSRLSGVELLEFSDNLPALIANSHLIVAMGGYNTVCDILSAGRPAVLLPRTAPRVEQKIRAMALAAAGRVEHLPLDEATPARFGAAIREGLGCGGRASGTTIDLGGEDRMIEKLGELLPVARNGSQRAARYFGGTTASPAANFASVGKVVL